MLWDNQKLKKMIPLKQAPKFGLDDPYECLKSSCHELESGDFLIPNWHDMQISIRENYLFARWAF